MLMLEAECWNLKVGRKILRKMCEPLWISNCDYRLRWNMSFTKHQLSEIKCVL